MKAETIEALRQEYPEVYQLGLPNAQTQNEINELIGLLENGTKPGGLELSISLRTGLESMRERLAQDGKDSAAKNEGVQALVNLEAFLAKKPSQNVSAVLAYLRSVSHRTEQAQIDPSSAELGFGMKGILKDYEDEEAQLAEFYAEDLRSYNAE